MPPAEHPTGGAVGAARGHGQPIPACTVLIEAGDVLVQLSGEAHPAGQSSARYKRRVHHRADAPHVVLSPHLDDAVLSTWSVLRRPGEVAVVNVFAGIPDSSAPPRCDRLVRATDSRVHMDNRAQRIATPSPWHPEPHST